MTEKFTLLELLVVRGLAPSTDKALRQIMAGEVRVNEQVVTLPHSKHAPDVSITLAGKARFVSRGGEKLQAAFSEWKLDVQGQVCADVGASTGGFTDCLLQNGAAQVYAVEVGKGILDWGLRNDPRVVLLEKTNVRYLANLPQPVGFVSIDVSFISLQTVLPVVAGWLTPAGQVVCLLKPQFEAEPAQVGRGGVVRDSQVHLALLERITRFATEELALHSRGMIKSPLLGPAGNTEFLLWFSKLASA